MKQFLLLLQSAPRRVKQLVLLLADASALPVLLMLAWSLRLDTVLLPSADNAFVFITATWLGLLCLVGAGVYRTVVRAFDEHFLRSLMLAIIVYSVTLFSVATIAPQFNLPRSTALVSGFFLFIWVWATRSIIRATLMRMLGLNLHKKSLLIYGAGSAGRQFVAAALRAPDFRPIAFLDDSQELIGTTINGLPVFAGARAAELVKRFNAKDIIIALPSASRARRKQILDLLEPLPVHVRALPGIDQLMRGEIRFSDAQEVDIADLLGRDPVPPVAELLLRDIQQKSVLVTGAGGSIGSELCRQILGVRPKRLVLIEQSEFALYQINNELRQRFPYIEILPILGSVMDGNRMLRLLKRHNIDTVYHAAAYKHVPLVEANPFEGVRNNAIGTYRTALAAMQAGVAKFVLISTDKAVRPTNIMGASKRLAELSLQALNLQPDCKTCFTMVRFGNVLGSSGSVVPLFRRQLAAGGPITVTHPDVTRYFMTIPEASQLVIQAGAMSNCGDVFVLDMGESVKIIDLARKMIRLSGMSERTADNPSGDIEIAYTGLRPGEKLYEELLIGDGNIEGTCHGRIMKAFEAYKTLAEMEAIFAEIERLAEVRDTMGLKKLLLWHVEGYKPDMRDEVLMPMAEPAANNVVPMRS
ncbi:MAG: nucleoside-diphosphate sugar epimerase/dehydratase [Moraxellaceae bacterium]|nr:nucleoside-diphosphate sugar epimerase/dehydratase [Moraxellaceae bacterium]MDZ4386015.1 nucleoside-diphosphate sugar epimerase/dehydratase [Moraxellaceae bacterium]